MSNVPSWARMPPVAESPSHVKSKRYGAISTRSVEDLDEVELAAFQMEARNAADSIMQRYANKPEFACVVAVNLRNLAENAVNRARGRSGRDEHGRFQGGNK